MRRALAGLGAVAVLTSGCASISAADEDACDRLHSARAASNQEEPSEDNLRRIVDEVGDIPGDEQLSPQLREAVRVVIRDVERLLDDRKAKFLGPHYRDALSTCMDLGW
ncbi:hypothetical protein [Trujillonella humicola]|uniref:hypothetical protein n=1 Tax=Trujillonella humicola TaxID=3383699 RepID=UPI0039065C03